MFGLYVLVALIDLAFDVITAFTINYSIGFPVWLNMTLNTIFYLLQLTLAFFFALFTLSITGKLRTETSPERIRIMFTAGLYLVSIGTVVTNSWSGILFYFDAQGHYLHGTYYPIMFAIVFLFMLVGIWIIVRYRERVTKAQFYSILSFVVLMVCAMVVQYLKPYFLITGAAFALAITTMYFTFQNPDDFIDKMTRLNNRAGFLVFFNQMSRNSIRTTDLVLIDLKNFKAINNLFGTTGGDEVIGSVGEFLLTVGSAPGCAFRIGSDQFALLRDRDHTGAMIKQITDRFEKIWRIRDTELLLQATICRISLDTISSMPYDCMLVIQSAINVAKLQNGAKCVIADDELMKKISRSLKIESLLGHIDSDCSLMLNFQPIYNVTKKAFTSLEVLLRMYHEELGQVSPVEFIEIAENRGVICDIGDFVLNETYRFLKKHELWNYGVETISINFSVAESLRSDLTERIRANIRQYPDLKTNIVIEITESTTTASPQPLKDMMDSLLELGISFALDDYSQGYSNNKTLVYFPFQAVKLDRALLLNAEQSKKAEILYRSIVSMVKEMGMKIIAEGAETAEQIEMLDTLGVDFIQGYYYSRPLPEADILKFLRNKQAESQDY